MKRALFFIIIFSRCCYTMAQNDSIPLLIQRFEASSDNNAAVAGILQLFKNTTLNDADKLALQTTLVHKYQELQQWDVCLSYCQQQVAKAHAQNNSLAEASFYKLIGNTYYHIPDKSKAVVYWQKCIAISEPERFNILLEQCYHNIGAVYLDWRINFDQAEKLFLKSINLCIANKNTETPVGRLHYRLLATLYERTNQLAKAEKLYKEIIEKNRQQKDSANLAESLMFFSDVLNKQNKFNEALQVSAEALEIARRVAKLDMVRTALNFHAMNLSAAGKYKEAYQVKDEATAIAESRYNNDLNEKLGEAEAKFKTAEAEHEKQLALIKERKEKQLYIFGLIGLFAVAALVFYNFYQKRSAKQKAQLLYQLQEEKERLSRDLHDNLGSQMALLSNNIETLDTNFKKQLDIDDNIEKVKGTSKQLLQTLRETIWILNKEQVTAQEFFDKLVDYAQRYLQSYSNIHLLVKEEFAVNKMLSSIEALQLFRICQEAITNACKYSGSPTLQLKGTTANDLFTVVISDAGKGFNAGVINKEGHYGLKNMYQRCAAIKAAVVLNTAAGAGTSISLTV
jgi:signal transduction histidine kinase